MIDGWTKLSQIHIVPWKYHEDLFELFSPIYTRMEYIQSKEVLYIPLYIENIYLYILMGFAKELIVDSHSFYWLHALAGVGGGSALLY